VTNFWQHLESTILRNIRDYKILIFLQGIIDSGTAPRPVGVAFARFFSGSIRAFFMLFAGA